MPFKGNADRRHHIAQQRRRVTNRQEYAAALRRRGSLTVWFTDAAIAAWRAVPRVTPGGQPHYSPLAITTGLTLRAVLRLALRQSEGLIGSILSFARSRSCRSRPFDREPAGRDTGGAAAAASGNRAAAFVGGQHGSEAMRRWRVADREARHEEAPVLAEAAHRRGGRHRPDRRGGGDDQRHRRRLAGRPAARPADGPGCVVHRRWGVRSRRRLRCRRRAPSRGCGRGTTAFDGGAERDGRHCPDAPRPASPEDRRARAQGLAEGGWIQSSRVGGGGDQPLQTGDRRRPAVPHPRRGRQPSWPSPSTP